MRHKAIDDVILRECVPRDGIKQVVVINSGMDTRPYRLTLPDVDWYEVDNFEVLELKRRLLQMAPKELDLYATKRVGAVKMIGLNVMKSFERLTEVLTKNGVDLDAPCLFVIEASLYNFHIQDAVKFIQSLPMKRRNVVVGTAFQRRMLDWVRDPENQKASPFLSELSYHWRNSFEGCRDAGAFKGWRVRYVRGLSIHARGYGYQIPPNIWGEGEELVFELHCGPPQRPAKKGQLAMGPSGPPATAAKKTRKTAGGGILDFLSTAVKLSALLCAGVVGHIHGDTIIEFAEEKIDSMKESLPGFGSSNSSSGGRRKGNRGGAQRR